MRMATQAWAMAPGDVEELYFPDEGYGFAKEVNRLLYYQQMAKFFHEHLLD